MAHVAKHQMEWSDGRHPKCRRREGLSMVTVVDNDGEETTLGWEEATHRE